MYLYKANYCFELNVNLEKIERSSLHSLLLLDDLEEKALYSIVMIFDDFIWSISKNLLGD